MTNAKRYFNSWSNGKLVQYEWEPLKSLSVAGYADFKEDELLKNMYDKFLKTNEDETVFLKIEKWSDNDVFQLCQKISALNFGCPVGILMSEPTAQELDVFSDNVSCVNGKKDIFGHNVYNWLDGDDFILICPAVEKDKVVRVYGLVKNVYA